mgnify:CR=1 FL=1
MPTKALVQGLTLNNTPKNALQNFWLPCLNSIKRWAKDNDWEYHFFDSALSPFDVGELLGIDYRHGSRDAQYRSGQFYKLQWVHSLCDQYEQIMWIDADIFAWGNPEVPIKFETHPDIFHTMQTSRELCWDRPNLSIFCSSSKTIRELCEWHETMLRDPAQRDDLYITLITLYKYGELGGFYDEHAIMPWCEKNKDRLALYTQTSDYFPEATCDWAHDSTRMFETCSEDSFLHFAGHNKQRMFNKFRAYKAYLAVISKDIE